MNRCVFDGLTKSLLRHLPLAAIFLLVFSGCEKVIDVDLSETDPTVVIEGNLSWKHAFLQVKISRTGSYFNTISKEVVDDASVFLETPAGVRMEAKSEGGGNYRLNNVPLLAGAEYKLVAEADGKEFSAVSVMNQKVKIDSLSCEYYKDARFFDGGYRIQLYFVDPPDQPNYYRIKVYKNRKRFNSASDLIVFDDNMLDGKSVQVRLRGQSFAVGDTATIELLSIDRNAWEYFSTLREMANLNPGSPSPANPISNFSNDALGYFSAWSHSKREVIIAAKPEMAYSPDNQIVLDLY